MSLFKYMNILTSQPLKYMDSRGLMDRYVAHMYGAKKYFYDQLITDSWSIAFKRYE